MSSPLPGILARGYLILLLSLTLVAEHVGMPWISLVLAILQGFALFRPPPKHRLDLMLTMLTLPLVPLGISSFVEPVFAIALLLPALPLLDRQLRNLALEEKNLPFQRGLQPTMTFNALAASLGSIAILAVVGNSYVLLGTAAMLFILFAIAIIQELLLLRQTPLETKNRLIRVVAHSTKRVRLELANKTSAILPVTLSSQYPWLVVKPETLVVVPGEHKSVEVTVSPPLAGPSRPPLGLSTQGPRGLLTAGYSLTPLELHVIPRARYASWLARQYLQTTIGGETGIAVESAISGLVRRRGVEFYGLREYQPGDPIKQIDWRHTFKFGDVMVKEYLEPVGGQVVLLVNLVAGAPEETDWLAYHLVMSAISAARHELSTFLFAYNEREVVLNLGPVRGSQALMEVLRLSARLSSAPRIDRVLSPPDVISIRRTARRLRQNGAGAENGGFGALLSLELRALEQITARHPANYVMNAIIGRSLQGATVTAISLFNHDAEALAVILSRLHSRGHRVINLFTSQ